VNLRKEGLEGYVEEFASMVRDIWKVTGDVGIEVLPFVPVVFDNLDVEGGLLLSGVRNWIRWLSDETGRVEIRKLGETGGREEALEDEPTTVFYKPVGVVLRSQDKESVELGNRGNMMSVVKGERRELKLRRALPAKEIMRLTNNGETRDPDEEEGEEEKRRGSFRDGVSMEGEFAFARAVEGFCKESVKEGRYRGTYLLNIRDQMKRRVRREVEAVSKVKVVTVGASEMGRLRREWSRGGAGKLELLGEVRVKGVLDRREVARIEGELEKLGGTPDRVVIGGPGNSLMAHEGGQRKGSVVRRVVTVRKDGEGRVEGLESVFHLCEPVKLTMCERRVIASGVAKVVKKCKELWPLVDVMYLGIFPRHVWKCCEARGHMGDLDPQVIHGSRLDLEGDVMDEVRRVGEQVVKLDWYMGCGLDREPTLEWIRQKNVVGSDGVHMTSELLVPLAGLIFRRLIDAGMEEPLEKRRRASY